MEDTDIGLLRQQLVEWNILHGYKWAMENVGRGGVLAVPEAHLPALLEIARLDAVELVAADPELADWFDLNDQAT